MRTIQPIASEAVANIREGRLPAIADLLETCQVFATDAQVVLDPQCVLKAAQ
ncbi:MAG: hypothetical protein HC890_17950 [Chloroflexaceae bacterium]|nr:hypothetical protein [Chloroflexaceae bacterium]